MNDAIISGGSSSPLRFAARSLCLGVAAFAVVTLAASPNAHAAGFASARFGGEHGNVVTTNPTALYYNPAGMGFSTGTHLMLDGSLALRHVTWERQQSADEVPDPADGQGANSGKATLFNLLAGPALGATHQFGDLTIGAGLFVPFGGYGTYDKNEKFENHPTYPQAADGIQRWSSIDGALAFIYLSAGAAYRLGPLSIGVAGNLIHSSVYSLEAKSMTGQGEPDTTREGRSELDVNGWHGSFGVGGMLETIPERLWLGASYQAQPALGAMTLDGTLVRTYQGAKDTTKVTFHQALPDVTRIGARFRAKPELEFRLFGEYTRWSVLVTQCVSYEGKECAVDSTGSDASAERTTIQNVRRKWKDSFGVRAGVSYWTSPKLELFGGTGFETAAVPDETLEPSLPDANNIAAALGARVQLSSAIFLAGSYTHLFYLNRDNTGKSKLAQANNPTRRADGGGKYTQWIGIFNANVELVF